VVSEAALAHENTAWYSTVRGVGFTIARASWPAIGYPSAWLAGRLAGNWLPMGPLWLWGPLVVVPGRRICSFDSGLVPTREESDSLFGCGSVWVLAQVSRLTVGAREESDSLFGCVRKMTHQGPDCVRMY
jgi:hypothetical protein